MKLQNPIIITPRLLPGVQVENSFVSIEYGGWSDDGRQEYAVHIDAPTFHYTFDDMKSGVGGGDLQFGLQNALGFLGYAGETQEPQTDLFPAHVCEWAHRNSDELSMLVCKIEESDHVLIEA